MLAAWCVVVATLAGDKAVLVFATILFEGWLPVLTVICATLFGIAVVRRLLPEPSGTVSPEAEPQAQRRRNRGLREQADERSSPDPGPTTACPPLRCGASRATSRLFIIAAGAAVGLGTLATLALLLGLTGWLGQMTAWLLVLGMGLSGGIDLGLALRRDDGRRRPVTVNGAIWLALPAAAAVGVASIAACVPPGMMWGGEPNGYDVVSYHLQIPREWSEIGRIVPLEHNVFSYFPLANEALFLVLMEQAGDPHAMLYAPQLLQVILLALCGLATAGAVRQLTPAHWLPATVAGTLVVSLPWSIMLGSIAYNEILLLLSGIVGIGALIIAFTLPRPHGFGMLLIAGLACGLGAATKYTAVPMLLIPGAVAVVLFRLRGDSLPAFWRLVFFGFAAIPFFLPWVFRNLGWTGNPVFPLATGLFGDAGRGEAFVDRWQTAHAPGGTVGHVLGRFVDEVLISPNYGYALLPLAIAAAISLFVLRRRERRPAILLACWLGMMMLVWLFATHLQSRFAFIAVAPAAILIGLALATPVRWPVMGLAVAITCLGPILAGHRLAERLEQTGIGAESIVGIPSLNYMTPFDTPEQVAGRPIYLVGDARAFYYAFEDVHYRTVFDVPPGEGALPAWLGDATEDAPGDAWVIVDPAEVERLARTYGTPQLEVDITRFIRPEFGGKAVLTMEQVRELLGITPAGEPGM